MWNVQWVTKSAKSSISARALCFLQGCKLAASQWLRQPNSTWSCYRRNFHPGESVVQLCCRGVCVAPGMQNSLFYLSSTLCTRCYQLGSCQSTAAGTRHNGAGGRHGAIQPVQKAYIRDVKRVGWETEYKKPLGSEKYSQLADICWLQLSIGITIPPLTPSCVREHTADFHGIFIFMYKTVM